MGDVQILHNVDLDARRLLVAVARVSARTIIGD
jgi:hypothetical protein